MRQSEGKQENRKEKEENEYNTQKRTLKYVNLLESDQSNIVTSTLHQVTKTRSTAVSRATATVSHNSLFRGRVAQNIHEVAA